MQPYLFPYLGYYQLLHATDVFVSYDDVQFIPRGYIHRNSLASGKFTVPLAKGSSRALITERLVHEDLYPKFFQKFYRGWQQAYGKAPHFADADVVLRRVMERPAADVATLAGNSVQVVADYLDLKAAYKLSSNLDYDRSLSGQDRMLSLLSALGATRYVNAIGGMELYDADRFAAAGVELRFLRPDLDMAAPEPGFANSVLHLLASHPPKQILDWLDQYTLIEKSST